MGFSFDNLAFGTLNDFTDGLNLAGSRRRSNSKDFVNRALRLAFGRDALATVNSLKGVVVHSRALDRRTYQRSGPFLMSYAQQTSTAPVPESGGGGVPDADESGAAETVSMNTPYYVYKVYIPETEPRPAPRSAEDSVIGSYPDVYVSPALEATFGLNNQIPIGGMVRVAWGDFQNLRSPEIIEYSGDIELTWSGDIAGTTSARRQFDNAPVSTVTSPLASPEAMAHLQDLVPSVPLAGKFTWQELGSARVILQDLLDYIASGEGWRTHPLESVNRGGSGDSPSPASEYILSGPLKNRQLQTMTIAEVQSLQLGGSNAQHVDTRGSKRPSGAPGFLAVGNMQFITTTLAAAVQKTGIPASTTKFTKITQENLGAYLLLGGQGGALGTYLTGIHENVGKAGQNLARIWASIPLQYPENNCGVGFSRYCVGTANSQDLLSKTPIAVVAKLQEARAAMAANSQMVALLRSKGINSTFRLKER